MRSFYRIVSVSLIGAVFSLGCHGNTPSQPELQTGKAGTAHIGGGKANPGKGQGQELPKPPKPPQ
jgi:hypothetical protein